MNVTTVTSTGILLQVLGKRVVKSPDSTGVTDKLFYGIPDSCAWHVPKGG